jgi:microcystin-dependent protein
LFSLIGTTYGGDGVTNFMLPDMQSVKTVSGAEVRYIICFEGIYPSRD